MNACLATAIQGYIISFVMTGSPSAAGAPVFPPYGPGGLVVNFKALGIEVMVDDTLGARCEWWQKGFYY